MVEHDAYIKPWETPLCAPGSSCHRGGDLSCRPNRRACACLNGLYRATALAVKGYRIFFFGDKFIKFLGLFLAADRTGVNYSAFFFRGRLNSHVAAVPGVLGFVFGFLAVLVCARVPMMSFVVLPLRGKIVFILFACGKQRKR